jgi:hypothetical protein
VSVEAHVQRVDGTASSATAWERDVVEAPSSWRRANGVYYTPPDLADVLGSWVVTASTRSVFDPSFGDGALLAAAKKRLSHLRVARPATRLYGVELDCEQLPRVCKQLRVPAGQLQSGDFFSFAPEDLPGFPYDTIVGNPPYVRHHLLEAEVRQRARGRAASAGIELNDRADAWAYFVAYLVTLLAEDGRLALLLPGSVLHADYALPLLHALGAGKGHIQILRVQKRLFPAVQERTVVLLIDHATAGEGELEYREVPDLAGLVKVLGRKSPQRRASKSLPASTAAGRFKSRLRWHLTPAEVELWEHATERAAVAELGDQVQIRIGVVTGANGFFVRSETEIGKLGRAARGVPIVPRGSWLTSTRWTAAADAAKAVKPSRLLVISPKTRQNQTLRRMLQRAEDHEIDKRVHCEKRDPWYAITDTSAPDLFLPYMCSAAPRVVVNEARATCTNAIHRLVRKPGASPSAAIALGSWTSLFRLSAELAGRSYGGGVLKLELGEAARLRVPLVDHDAGAHLAAVEVALEEGGVGAAREKADELVLCGALKMREDEIATIAGAARRLEKRRRG